MPTNYDLWKVKVSKNPQGRRHRYWEPVMVDGSASRRELTFVEWPFPKPDLEIDEEIIAKEIVKGEKSNQVNENDVIIIDKTRDFEVAHYIARRDLIGGKLYICKTDRDDVRSDEKWQRIFFSRDESRKKQQPPKYFKSDWEGKKGDLLIRCESQLGNYKTITYTYVVGEKTIKGELLNSEPLNSIYFGTFDQVVNSESKKNRIDKFLSQLNSELKRFNNELDKDEETTAKILCEYFVEAVPGPTFGTVSHIDLYNKVVAGIIDSPNLLNDIEKDFMKELQPGSVGPQSAVEVFGAFIGIIQNIASFKGKLDDLKDENKGKESKDDARKQLRITFTDLSTNISKASGSGLTLATCFDGLQALASNVLGGASSGLGVLTSSLAAVRFGRKAYRANARMKEIGKYDPNLKPDYSANLKPLLDYVLPKLKRRRNKMIGLSTSSGIGFASSTAAVVGLATGITVLSAAAAFTGVVGIAIGAGLTIYAVSRWRTKKTRRKELADKGIPNSPEAFAKVLIETYKTAKDDQVLIDDRNFCIDLLKAFNIDVNTLVNEENDQVAVDTIVRHLTK